MYVPFEPNPISTDTDFKTVFMPLKGVLDTFVFETYSLYDGQF